jgi:hypothetical protein
MINMPSKRGKNQTAPESENSSGQEMASEVSPPDSKNSLDKPKGSGLAWIYVLAGCLVCTALAELWTTHTTLKLQDTIQEIQIKIKALEDQKPSQAVNHENMAEDKLNEILAEQAILFSRIESLENHLDALSQSTQAAFEKIEELSQSQENNQAIPSEDSSDAVLNRHSPSLSSLVHALESDAPIDQARYETLIPETLLSQLKDFSKSPAISKSALLEQLNDLSQQIPPAILSLEDNLTKKLGNFITIRKISPNAHESESLATANALVSKIQAAITHDNYSGALEHFNHLPKDAKDVLAPLHSLLEQRHKKQILLQKMKLLLISSSPSNSEPGHDTP